MPARLGQHFLTNRRPVRAAVEALALRKGDRIIEIGPGKGALTFPLHEAARRTGAKLTLVERDRDLAAELRGRLQGTDTEIIEGDAVRELPGLLAGARGRAKVAGNIPYYITGKLLRVLGEAAMPPERTVLLVQREVAERLLAKPPKFNLLAAAVQSWAAPKLLMAVPRTDFAPPPKVDSALILLERADALLPSRAACLKALRTVFRQPRKTLLNNLRDGAGLSREGAGAVLKRLALPETARPQDLDTAKLIQLARLLP